MRTDEKSNASEVGVLNKALDLVETLLRADRLTVAELAAATGVNKAAAYRILHTLERRQYVTREASEVRRYSLGPAFRAFARDPGSPRALLLAAEGALRQLWEEYGETVNLGVMAQHQLLYLDILESDQGLRTTVTVGALDHLHSTALGKAMLAALPVSEARAILSRTDRVARTPRTITSLPEILGELDLIRQRGYALDDEENEPGARCVASAIIDAVGRPLGALSVSGPAWRLPDELVERMGSHLVKVCEQVSGELN